MSTDERITRAQEFYERSVFGGEDGVLAEADEGLDDLEADLALARGRVIHARYLVRHVEDARELALFERAVELYQELGDDRGQGEALLWVGIFHQVVRGNQTGAVPFLVRALELAEAAGDRLTMSYALRHLGIADHVAGNLEAARDQLEESVRLRRQIGFLPGVAANLVGLTYIALGQGRADDARSLIEEAARIATASRAAGIMPSIEEARSALGPAPD